MTRPAALPPAARLRSAPAPEAEAQSPQAVPEAALEVRRALERVRLSQRGYAAVRDRGGKAAVTRARTDWGLAVLEWIEASAALAEAEDRRDPARAARENRGGFPAAAEDPARLEVADCWQAYQAARRDGRPDRIEAGRDRWRAALVTWFQAQADQRAAEDQYRSAGRRPAEAGEAAAAGAPEADAAPPPVTAAASPDAQPDGTASGPAAEPTWPARARRRPRAARGGLPPAGLGWEPAGPRPGSGG